jgi:hypothetical protein
MAIACLEFPSIETVVIEEDQMAVPKPKIDWKGWLALVITALCAIGGAAWGIAHEFSQLDKHIARVETAVRIIGAKQGGDTKTLMDEALTVAINDSRTGRIDGAKSVLAVANRLVEQQSEAHIPATQETFDNALIQYHELKQIPPLRNSAHEGMIQLADYRSAITTPPQIIPHVYLGEMSFENGHVSLKDSLIIGNNAIRIGHYGADLDGLVMHNVVFMDVDIYYHGGFIVMDNVKFLNCRFHVTDSIHGDELLEAAIEAQTQLRIG